MAEKATRPAMQKIGALVEDFTLTSIDGNNVSLRMLMKKKKAAVIVFWSGACSHCTRYDEYLNTFQERHPELGVAAIASRRGETRLQLHDGQDAETDIPNPPRCPWRGGQGLVRAADSARFPH